jgi:hypothetical protein
MGREDHRDRGAGVLECGGARAFFERLPQSAAAAAHSKTLTRRRRRILGLAALLAGLSHLSLFAAADPTPDQLRFFESKIRPVLAERCYKCHSVESGKSKGSLLLDSRDGVLKGGDTSAAITPGDVAKSLLVTAIKREDKDLQMPPDGKGDPLTTEQVKDFEDWIKMGAPDPRVAGAKAISKIDQLIEEGRKHWAFQPVKRPEVPPGAANPIDAFVLQKLSEKGLTLSPPAEPRTLIRRIYFDLIGLPPTFEEVEAFVRECANGSEETQKAIAQTVDRLLASPRYGERWGRHWLDVARYADTYGAIFNGDDRYPYAWTYRDYVIRAFNEDLPYDRFLREQLAADRYITGNDNHSLAALGFLTVGRRADRRVDDNVYDDRIDVIARGLLGLTVGCARCHDHKLEPIPTRDYYSLYGVLHGGKEPDVYPEMKPQADTPERKDFLQQDEKVRLNYISVVAGATFEAFDREYPRLGQYLLALSDGKGVTTDKDAGLKRSLLKPRNLNLRIYDQLAKAPEKWWTAHESVLSPWREFAALPAAEFGAKAKELAAKFAANTDGKLCPSVAQAFAGDAPASLSEVAARYDKLFAAAHKARQEEKAAAIAEARQLQPSDLEHSEKELKLAIIDRLCAIVWSNAKADDAVGAILGEAKGGPLTLPASEFQANQSDLFTPENVKSITAAAKAVTDLEASHPGAPARAMAMFDDKPFDAKVFVRGNPKTPGPEAPRAWFTVLSPPDHQPWPKESTGRQELAEAIASPNNPLTARVFVNRVWAWHFGEGLVRTTSNFGLRGERPTHPELLDWLASEFVAKGWSVKQLQREIILSATYQQASAVRPEAAKVDSENQLLWRFSPRPLEFEPFRDSILATAGKLEFIDGGKAVDIAGAQPNVHRTVFGTVDRKNLPNLFRSFDFPDPSFTSSGRIRTALTPRALVLLNSPLVVDAAKALATRAKGDSPEERVRQLYRIALQREPRVGELKKAVEFVATAPLHDIVMPEASDWRYGLAHYETETKSLRDFVELKISGDTAKPASTVAGMGNLKLNAEGGETGASTEIASVRRWQAPYPGKVNIAAELSHTSKAGDSVTARVLHNRLGLLGEWKAANSSQMTEIKDVEMRKGDTLDFVVTESVGDKEAAYQWAPTIIMPEREIPGMFGMAMRWDAKRNFQDPASAPKPLNGWEELAQVLLMSNEFAALE